jgi:hypothetical protein
MSHVRTQLRAGLVAALTGLATTGNRVHASRMRPVKAEQMPCLLIATGDERIESTALQYGPLDRALTLHVSGFAMGATVDDTLDQIAHEVETALASKNYKLQGIEVDFDDELEKPVGSITLSFEILYFTQAGSPGVSA